MLHKEEISLKRPQIPQKWYRPSMIGTLAYIAYNLALYIVPAMLARMLLLLHLPLPLLILMTAPLIWLSAQGMLLFSWVGHEGFHLSLHRNKFVSALIGTFFASALPTYFETGAAISHWNHHRFTNQASDPDCQIFQKFQNFWSRLLFARSTANFYYFINTVRMAFNLPLSYSYKFPFKSWSIVMLAWANIGFSLLWLVLYAAIAIYDPATAIVLMVLPGITMYAISALQPYLEHAGTKVGLGRDAKSQTSLLFTILYFGNNYHLEHHLYPGVPCYRLPALHRWLKEKGFYDRMESMETDELIEPHVIKPYLKAFHTPYPEAGKENSTSDPMLQM
ncbi:MULTISPECIES: fatty acid desaturase [unclassified Nostoc]|uniref:fatty acid desaturase family protein n=1 Tax=unclassified Nostoc TaxID=2593658 RepID=UPI002AD34CEE|nr:MULTISPECIES: fatty acid desaturase [unclassified Nostoc]MDZ8120924.1 fatty acid desaturase [Nostoc sp. CmiVER01]MDZ8226282.1 fatty acid desaturase [Nostoc sp. ChiVER01]